MKTHAASNRWKKAKVLLGLQCFNSDLCDWMQWNMTFEEYIGGRVGGTLKAKFYSELDSSDQLLVFHQVKKHALFSRGKKAKVLLVHSTLALICVIGWNGMGPLMIFVARRGGV